jgi:hypothetical protein
MRCTISCCVPWKLPDRKFPVGVILAFRAPGLLLPSFFMPADPPTEEEAVSRSGSTSYREFLADREDLMRHKWLMSEKAGRDVGLEAALLDWADHHRVAMRKQRAR